MATKGTAVYLSYYAWNTVTGNFQTGDAANHTIYYARDGATPTLSTNSPTECSTAKQPGLYQVLTTTGESTCNMIAWAGVSTTAGVVIWGAQMSFELIPANGLDLVATETGYNLPQSVALILDMVCAKLSGLPAGPAVIRDVNDTRNAATITFDSNNNRITVSLNPPSV